MDATPRLRKKEWHQWPFRYLMKSGAKPLRKYETNHTPTETRITKPDWSVRYLSTVIPAQAHCCPGKSPTGLEKHCDTWRSGAGIQMPT
jgi:hypothetical protein